MLSNTKDLSQKDFTDNEILSRAVIRSLEIIGEAVNQLEKAFQEENKSLRDIHIPIEEIVEMRNILIHEYFGVDVEIIWDVIQNKLPILEKQIKQILNE